MVPWRHESNTGPHTIHTRPYCLAQRRTVFSSVFQSPPFSWWFWGQMLGK